MYSMCVCLVNEHIKRKHTGGYGYVPQYGFLQPACLDKHINIATFSLLMRQITGLPVIYYDWYTNAQLYRTEQYV